MPSRVSYPLLAVPLVDEDRRVARPWQQLFQALFLRAGQDFALTNLELAAQDATMEISIEGNAAAIAAQQTLEAFGPMPGLPEAAITLADVFTPGGRPQDVRDIERLFDDRGAQFLGMGGDADIESGVYTPILTNVANLTGSTAYQCQYLRVGSVGTVSGIFDADAEFVLLTQLGISLPIASNLANTQQCAGLHAIVSNPSESGVIFGDAANNRAEAQWISSVALGNLAHSFMFTYRII